MTGVASAGPVRRAVAVLVATVALAVSAVFLLGREPAVRLTGSWPAADAVLAEPPAEFVLTFASAPRLAQAHAGVSGPDGTVLAEPMPRGTGVVVPVQPGGPGEYAVNYHLQLADGTSISGVRRWTVVAGVTPGLTAPDTAGPDAGGPDAGGPPGHAHLTTDGTTLILLALDLVLIAVVLPLLVPRRRRR